MHSQEHMKTKSLLHHSPKNKVQITQILWKQGTKLHTPYDNKIHNYTNLISRRSTTIQTLCQ